MIALSQSTNSNSRSVPSQRTSTASRGHTGAWVTTAVRAQAALSNACAGVAPKPRTPTSASCGKCSQHAPVSTVGTEPVIGCPRRHSGIGGGRRLLVFFVSGHDIDDFRHDAREHMTLPCKDVAFALRPESGLLHLGNGGTQRQDF